MIKRTIEISTAGTYVKARDEQLFIMMNDQTLGKVPLEDIGILIIDNPQVSCSQSALNGVCSYGGAVLLCDRSHHPSSLLLPLSGNTLHTKKLKAQVNAGKTIHKRLWQQIVKSKLKNQATLLEKSSDPYNKLMKLAEEVKSDDKTNCEAQGAKIYFRALFGNDFRRFREGDSPNNLLNYGYMTLRAAVARAICITGLHPALGIHHKHRENAFCLADDLMEPYRPYIDKYVVKLASEGYTEVNKEVKRELLKVLTESVRLWKGKGPLMVAVQKTASSLSNCYLEGEQKLDLPKL